MEKTYNHQEQERAIYKKWEDSGAFSPREDSKKTFTIVMPPPNANDPLHVGHAMFIAVEDILIRYHRLLGDSTLWLPGTDHAGIETQFVFEKKLAKEDKSRFDFDRETLYSMIWDYVQTNSGVATEQMKRLGASADWNRFTFTLDPQVVDFVYQTFEKMHKDDLVYRALKLVNYCTHCGTAYSELEVDHEERADKLYHIDYPLSDGSGVITVATTRPETIFGDVAVAVNPTDKRYTNLIGKKVRLPLTDREIEIVADDGVDMEFGTGAVKITPAHDAFDWSVVEKNSDKFNLLETVNEHTVIGVNGKMTKNAGEGFENLSVSKAREKVVADLHLEQHAKTITHNIGICYRCKRVIEPLPLPQFFISVAPLTKAALKALDTKETVIHGTGREAILRTWLTGLKDWNISRQIVWGIRMPVWYNVQGHEENVVVSFIDSAKKQYKGTLRQWEEEGVDFNDIKNGLQQLIVPVWANVPFVVQKEIPTAPGKWIQETDTFDTWFSSSQWPVVTLKIREGDFERFYPTSVMETAYEILPFWVMRMMLLGIYLTGSSPFKDVYLHGLVRDAQGRKMSKSVGNVINPLEFVDKYGADAIRMGLVMGSTPGQDKSVGEQTIKGMRNFSNKIWNAGRFIKMSVVEKQSDSTEAAGDNAFKQKLNETVTEVTRQMDGLKVGLATETIYSAFWHWFCDECIEQAKRGELSWSVLNEGLKTFLVLLHPFAPFVTEATYQEVFSEGEKDLLILQEWPRTSAS